MEEKALRDVITDLEIANKNLHLLSKKIGEDDKILFSESYNLIKKSIQKLYEEEVYMEVHKCSEED